MLRDFVHQESGDAGHDGDEEHLMRKIKNMMVTVIRDGGGDDGCDGADSYVVVDGDGVELVMRGGQGRDRIWTVSCTCLFQTGASFCPDFTARVLRDFVHQQ